MSSRYVKMNDNIFLTSLAMDSPNREQDACEQFQLDRMSDEGCPSLEEVGIQREAVRTTIEQKGEQKNLEEEDEKVGFDKVGA